MDHRQSTVQGERKENERCSVEQARRGSIKLPPGPPKIMIVVPVGAKTEKHTYDIPRCLDEEGNVNENCPCPNHGKKATTPYRNQGLVPAEWALNIANIVTPLNGTIGYLIEKGRLSAEARNRMTQRAMEVGSTYIFYWDDDVILHPHTLYTMHNILDRNPDIGLVSGVYCTREDPTEPFIYKEQGQGAYWNFSIDPEDPPEDIHGCGGGCIMARLEDVKKMTQPYWTDEQIVLKDHVSTWGHDIRFVKQFREQTGKRTVVQGHLLCGHVDVEKQKVYELPKDSPPYRALERKGKLKQIPVPWGEIQESPPLTLDYLDAQLMASNGRRKMFVVSKEEQSEADLQEVLSKRFKTVPIHSMDDKWVAICEQPIGVNGNG